MQRRQGDMPFLCEQVQFLANADRGRVAIRTTETGDHQGESDIEDQSLHCLREDRIEDRVRAARTESAVYCAFFKH